MAASFKDKTMGQLAKMFSIGTRKIGACTAKSDIANTHDYGSIYNSLSCNVSLIKSRYNLTFRRSFHRLSLNCSRLIVFVCLGGFLAKGNYFCCTLEGDRLASLIKTHTNDFIIYDFIVDRSIKPLGIMAKGRGKGRGQSTQRQQQLGQGRTSQEIEMGNIASNPPDDEGEKKRQGSPSDPAPTVSQDVSVSLVTDDPSTNLPVLQEELEQVQEYMESSLDGMESSYTRKEEENFEDIRRRLSRLQSPFQPSTAHRPD